MTGLLVDNPGTDKQRRLSRVATPLKQRLSRVPTPAKAEGGRVSRRGRVKVRVRTNVRLKVRLRLGMTVKGSWTAILSHRLSCFLPFTVPHYHMEETGTVKPQISYEP